MRMGAQGIRFFQCFARIVDESRLILLPILFESGAISGRERPERQKLDSFGALPELGFSASAIAHRLKGSLVLRPELLMQLPCPALAHDDEGHSGECDESDYSNDDGTHCFLR